MRLTGKGNTKPGYENRNGQVVVRCTEQRGTDHFQFVYVLHCKHCGHVYGANGTDIQRHARSPASPWTSAEVRPAKPAHENRLARRGTEA